MNAIIPAIELAMAVGLAPVGGAAGQIRADVLKAVEVALHHLMLGEGAIKVSHISNSHRMAHCRKFRS